MQEKTGAQLLKDAADYIEANGMLFDAWDSEDGTEDLPPCCCLIGTLRLMDGLPPKPPQSLNAVMDVMDGPAALGEAVLALGAQIEAECKVLGEQRYGDKAAPTAMEWGDHYADIEVVMRKRRGGNHREWRRLKHEDGDRGHVVRVLRQAAGRCES